MISGAHGAVIGRRKVLGVVIREIGLPTIPIDMQLVLVDSSLDPEIAHVHCLGALGADGLVGNAGSRGVVSLNGSGWLRMPQLFEESS